ncbi:MAG: retroviral-like aspartic protease [Planctomycetes bacterium]|nr:retroviral-like aspartic protease [Planctomycetota bacterium]
MGKIVKKLRLMGDSGELEIEVLLDSGAGASLVRADVAESITSMISSRKVPCVFHGVNGEEALRSDRICHLVIEMKGKFLDGRFYLVDRMPREMILGVDFMQMWGIILDLRKEDYTVGVDPQAIEIA